MPPPAAPVNRSADASALPSGALRTGQSCSTAQRLSLLLLAAACGAIRVVSLAAKPFWFDECFSAEIARLDWRNFLHLLWWREANMSLYYLLLRIWMSLNPHAGQSEFFIRSLSVVFATATVPAIYWLARLLYDDDQRVALIAAALFTFNAYSVRYSQEARSYALFVLLATLASGFFVPSVHENSRRNRLAYILAGILAVYAHFYALLLLAAHWLALRLRSNHLDVEGSRAALMRYAWRTIGVAVLPLLIFVVKTGAGPIRWIPRPTVHDVLQFCEQMAGSNTWPLAAIYCVSCIIAIAPLGRLLRAPA